MRWLALHNWVTNTLEKNRLAEGMSLAHAVATAKELQQADDFTQPYNAFDDPSAFVGPLDNLRLNSIAGVAAAVVLFDFNWALRQNQLEWCRDVLLRAAQVPAGDHFMDDRHSLLIDNPQIIAARGLGAFGVNATEDQQIRELLLRLATDPHLAMLRSILRGLYQAWDKDAVLCWNIVSLILTQSWPTWEVHAGSYSAKRSEAEAAWIESTFQEHLESLRSGGIPTLPSITETGERVFLYDAALCAIGGMPLEKLMGDPKHRAKIIQFAGHLLAWTIAKNMPVGDEPYRRFSDIPYNWNMPFLDWQCLLARNLSKDETYQHILNPLRKCWPSAPYLIAELLWDGDTGNSTSKMS